jgi:hypothetical protein
MISKIKTLFIKFRTKFIRKQIIIPVIIAIVLYAGFNSWDKYLISALGIIDIVMLSILAFSMWAFAGYTVFKSLFLLAAELSLLIFLAQSFCSVAVAQRSASSNDAMKTLLLAGLTYVVIAFFISLRNHLKGYYEKVKNEKWSSAKIFVIFLFFIFLIWFLWQIYEVIDPIIRNLCVYK